MQESLQQILLGQLDSHMENKTPLKLIVIR